MLATIKHLVVLLALENRPFDHLACFSQSPTYRTHDRVAASAILNCFEPANPPVLAGLESSYGVCDRLCSPVLDPLLPNRVYTHAGTSRGRLDLALENGGMYGKNHNLNLSSHTHNSVSVRGATNAQDFWRSHETQP